MSFKNKRDLWYISGDRLSGDVFAVPITTVEDGAKHITEDVARLRDNDIDGTRRWIVVASDGEKAIKKLTVFIESISGPRGWGGHRPGAGRKPRKNGRRLRVLKVALTDREFELIKQKTTTDSRRLVLLDSVTLERIKDSSAERCARMEQAQRERDEALPVQYGRGRSKLFKV